MQGSQKETGELDVIWLVVGILLFCGIIFFIFRNQIIGAILWIKYFELRVISLFMVNTNYSAIAQWIHAQPASQVKFAELHLLSLEIGKAIKYPCILICITFIAVLYFKHPQSKYRETESMNSLSTKVKKIFPAINIISGLDLVNTPIDQGPWAMAETPIEFAKRNKLIHRDPATEKIILDHNKAKLIFTQQLGPSWQGIDALKPHQKALFAIFAAFANYKRDEAEQKMEEIAKSLTADQVKTGKINFNTEALLKQYQDTPVIQKIIKRHAYVNSIFMELLTEARRSGIVLNSLYLWLKPLDRQLWYVLNNVGRKAVFTEAAAAQAHWIAEKRLGFAIAQPMIDEAVYALDEAIQSRIIKDI